MRSLRFFSAFAVILFAAIIVSAQAPAGQGGAPGGAPANKPMVMTISGFADGTDIPTKFTQVEKQISPAISWTNVPAAAQSLVLNMHDLEAARNKGTEDMMHWLVWNIPVTETGLPEGVPMGAQLANGAYQQSATGPVYRGPGAPAAGPRHHYTFELYALDIKLDIQPATDPFETRASVMKAMQGHVVGKAVYMGLFHRPQ